jgi:hypothetical protein
MQLADQPTFVPEIRQDAGHQPLGGTDALAVGAQPGGARIAQNSPQVTQALRLALVLSE